MLDRKILTDIPEAAVEHEFYMRENTEPNEGERGSESYVILNTEAQDSIKGGRDRRESVAQNSLTQSGRSAAKSKWASFLDQCEYPQFNRENLEKSMNKMAIFVDDNSSNRGTE